MLINKHICIQLHIQIYIISIPSLWANLPNGSKDFSLGLKLLKVLKAISLSIPSERKFSIHIRDPWTTNPPPPPSVRNWIFEYSQIQLGNGTGKVFFCLCVFSVQRVQQIYQLNWRPQAKLNFDDFLLFIVFCL